MVSEDLELVFRFQLLPACDNGSEAAEWGSA